MGAAGGIMGKAQGMGRTRVWCQYLSPLPIHERSWYRTPYTLGARRTILTTQFLPKTRTMSSSCGYCGAAFAHRALMYDHLRENPTHKCVWCPLCAQYVRGRLDAPTHT